MDGNNMDIKNLDNILFSDTEVKYLNKIYKTVPRKYMPKKPEAVRDLQALNRAILDKQKTVKKENCKDRGQGFQSFMNAAEANGYITKYNYGLYATFYDVYDPNDPTMKRSLDEILKKKVTEHTKTRRSNMDIKLFIGITAKCQASKNTLKAIEDPNAQNALDKMIHINARLFTDAQKGRSLGFDVKDVPRKQEKMENAPKNPYENMTLEEMERAFNKLNRDFERKQREKRVEEELENELNELDEQVNKKEEKEPQKEEEKKEEVKKEEEEIKVDNEVKNEGNPEKENLDNEVKIENKKEEENLDNEKQEEDLNNEDPQKEEIQNEAPKNEENVIEEKDLNQNLYGKLIDEENPELDVQNENVRKEENVQLENEEKDNIQNENDNIQNENDRKEENDKEEEEIVEEKVDEVVEEKFDEKVDEAVQEKNEEVVEEKANEEVNVEKEEEKEEKNAENNAENNVENNNEQQMQENVIEQPQPVVDPNARPVRPDQDLVLAALNAEAELQRNTLTLRGSSEYKNVREEFSKALTKLAEKRAQASRTGDINGMSEKDARELRGDMINVMNLCDKYLGKKFAEKDNSLNAKLRVGSVKSTFDAVEEIVHALDTHIESFAEREAPTLDEQYYQYKSAKEAIDNAKLHLRGSKEFDEAAEAFDDITLRVFGVARDFNGHEIDMTSTELITLRNRIVHAQDLVNQYLNMKSGNAVGDNANKRTSAMSAAANLLELSIRRIDQVMEQKFSKEPESLEKLNNRSAPAFKEIQDADKGVYFGSKEYEAAKNSYKIFDEKLKQLSDPNHQLTHREADQLMKALQDASRDVSAYLNTKNETEFTNTTTHRRVNIMRKAGDVLIETKRRLDILNNERRAEALKTDPVNLRQFERMTTDKLKEAKTSVGGSKVWFGGEDYDKAAALYETTAFHELQREAARETNPPSIHELQAEYRELVEAKEATLVYIERKEKERDKSSKKTLDAKGTERLHQMKNAYDSLNTRIDIVEAKIQEMEAKEIKESKDKMKDFVNKMKREIPRKEGLEKIAAMKAADAASNLLKLSEKSNLNSSKESIRHDAASLFLAQSIKNKTIASSLPPTMDAYERMVNRIANSPEFKAALPDNKLNQNTCRQLLVNPNTLKRIGNTFSANVQKAAAAKNKAKNLAAQKDLNKANKPEIKPGPANGK